MIDAQTSRLIDAAVVVGLAGVLPLALGGWRRWTIAALSAAVALAMPQGVAAGGVASGAAVIAALALRREVIAAGLIGFWHRADFVRVVASVWALVATGTLVASRLGLAPVGIREPIVELTAVHYLFAGVGALTLADATQSTAAVVITSGAPPIVALGFLTGWAAPQVGGAVLMAAGVFVVAALELHTAVVQPAAVLRRALLAVSGLAVWAPMFLAVAWAAGQHWNVPALSVPAMARWHGVPNALGFVIAGLAATRTRSDREVTACV